MRQPSQPEPHGGGNSSATDCDSNFNSNSDTDSNSDSVCDSTLTPTFELRRIAQIALFARRAVVCQFELLLLLLLLLSSALFLFGLWPLVRKFLTFCCSSSRGNRGNRGSSGSSTWRHENINIKMLFSTRANLLETMTTLPPCSTKLLQSK